MKSFAQSFYIIALATILELSVVANPVYAQEGSWAVPTVQEFSDAIMETVSGVIHKEGSETQSVLISMLVISCEILGCSADLANPFSYNKSAVAGISKGIELVYANPPATTYAFIVDAGKTLGFLPKTYAQGVGFTGMTALLPIWKAFRNVAYGIIAIVLIIVGFMVMLRKKIDPKTVVTVQNSIPRIVIALILVTFSYAIVGFLIDVMYLFMVLMMNLIIREDPARFGADTVQKYVGGNFGTAVAVFGTGLWESIKDLSKLFPWWSGYGAGAAGVLPIAIGFVFSGFKLAGAVAGVKVVGGVALSLFLIFALIVIFGMVRLLLLLLDAYIHIIISIVVAPFYLMLEAIPGVNTLGAWLRQLISKLIVFPTVAIVLLITHYLTSDQIVGGLWSPPFLFGSDVEGTVPIVGFITLGMLLSLPSIVAAVQKPFKAEPVMPAGMGAVVAPISGVFQSAMGTVSTFYYGAQLKQMFFPGKSKSGESGGHGG